LALQTEGVLLSLKLPQKLQNEESEMAVLRARRNRRKRKSPTRRRGAEDVSATSETNFRGPNVNKRHRKPDEIYGDTSIPDSARKE
jgi:hypothetical protein